MNKLIAYSLLLFFLLSLLHPVYAVFPVNIYNNKQTIAHQQVVEPKVPYSSAGVRKTQNIISVVMIVAAVILFAIGLPLFSSGIEGFFEGFLLLGIALGLGLSGLILLIKNGASN